MHAGATGWPAGSGAGDAMLRRILAAFWGAALASLLLLSTLSVTGGFAFVDVESPAGRYQRVITALAGVAAMVGAWRGTTVWGWVVLVAVPLLAGLGLWEHLEVGGAWWQAWWQPALGCALVGVPAWLLLGRGLTFD